VWNEKRTDTITELFCPGCIAVGGDGVTRGLDEWRAFHQSFVGAFPDLHLDVENITADGTGEWVAVRWTATGTHLGDTLGIPHTGRKMSMNGLSLVRIRDGQFIAGYDAYDQEAMLAQLQPQ
jgi:steroid delta-isomerase-like uncharacterized protein